MDMIWFILFLISFFYLLNRINKIEMLLNSRRLVDDGESNTIFSKQTVKKSAWEEPGVMPLEPTWPTVPVMPQQAGTQTISKEPYDSELEFKLGSKFFTVVGAVAVLVGIGFFFRYVFERDLITETMRVVIGLVSGLALLGVGAWAQKKYALYGQIVTGGGLGILYLSIYAAFNFYALVTQPTAFIGMMFVTAFGVALAVVYDAMPLAAGAALGGFLTPFLLSTNVNNPHGLFVYILILNIGFLGMTLWKSWRPLVAGNFVGTVFVYSSWYFTFYTPDQFFLAQTYATIFFALFLGVSLVQYFVGRLAIDEGELALVTALPAVYYVVSYDLINDLYPDWMGFFTITFAALYTMLAVLVATSGERNIRMRDFFIGIAVTLYVIAAPIQFEKEWITIAWAVEGGVLMYLGFSLGSRILRVFSQGVFFLMFVRLVTLDSALPFGEAAFFNTRVLTYGLSLASALSAAILCFIKRQALDKEESKILPFLFIEVFVLLSWVVTLEITDFHPTYYLPVMWSIVALLGAGASLKIQMIALRGAAYLLFICVGLRLFLFESAVVIYSYSPVFNSRVFAFLTAVVSAGILLSLLRKNKESISEEERRLAMPTLFLAINSFLLYLISAELLDYFEKQYQALSGFEQSSRKITYENIKNMALSVAWIMYAVGLLMIGIARKSTSARFFSIFLFGIVILKVFLYDTSNLDTFYRFVSFITLGVILLLAGYLYNRYRERIAQFIQVEP
ncbi:MAG: DUF2339 domain-containing protein [Patescibacteria group bacterium]